MRYKDAGVGVDSGEEFTKRIKSLVESTFGPRVLTALGESARAIPSTVVNIEIRYWSLRRMKSGRN